jgi:predicted nucleic acid-binding protein
MAVLEALFERVIVPEAVSSELKFPAGNYKPVDVEQFPFIRVLTVVPPASMLGNKSLGLGEIQAIALAKGLEASILLIDEKTGKRYANELGLKTLGVYGVLLLAKDMGIIDSVVALVDRLIKELRFFTSEAVRRQIADLAGEELP